MRINENEMLIGDKCVLVPYCAHHVLKYHEWMQNEELLKLTSSEPLSLEEEHEMQKSWQTDADKLTFIILDKGTFDSTGNEIDSMAGDINAFLIDDSEFGKCAEISVMVAEEKFRKRGIAHEVVSLIIAYVERRLGLFCFLAKIDDNNLRSASLFKKLGFQLKNYSSIFASSTFVLERKSLPEMQTNLNFGVYKRQNAEKLTTS
ncbi:acetyltransferase (GNAT) domain-containing protein [Ditylenchus destructor]|uniref:Acetyltransferase (GNAT) domain-containing protein n=1 Tax=Ditylenchus destructor TaxID=166010 RepID=A0AAD4N796_9BILA|nr:acetyltransferase (GNAT) domain-containing protein [Ditylenchus destructor]